MGPIGNDARRGADAVDRGLRPDLRKRGEEGAAGSAGRVRDSELCSNHEGQMILAKDSFVLKFMRKRPAEVLHERLMSWMAQNCALENN